MTIHYARLSNSPRLQRLLAFLRSCGFIGASTREIIRGADVCAVNTCIDELRANGFQIECRAQGRSRDGASVYRYFLKEP